ncbi:hypothetical protein, partial [Burkholderia ubonensis]|uniref:hypothetical protein n=1 Tax=Burkholderia ubonensis TaxID=101571 RepID=UPI000B293786
NTTVPSRSATVRVIGEIRKPPPPVVDENQGGTLPADTALAHVTVPNYPGKDQGDLVTLVWAGKRQDGSQTDYRQDFPVTERWKDEPLPFTVDGPQYIAPLQGGTVDVYYLVDALDGTQMRGQPVESEHLPLQVGVGAGQWPKPSVLEAPDEVLPPNATRATVQVPGAGLRQNDTVDLSWIGNTTGHYTDRATVRADGQQQDFVVGSSAITGNQRATITYTVNGSPPSLPLNLRIGAQMEDLPPPTVQEADGTTLDPLQAQAALNAVVTYPDIQDDDRVSVTWTGAPGTPAEGSHTTPAERVGTERPKKIALPVSVVAFALGKTVTVSYTVTRNDDESPPSQPLDLNVGALPNSSLPTPVIDKATGNELDLASFTGDPKVTVAPWPFIATAQKVWLRVRGTLANGSADTIVLYTASGVVSSEVTNGLSKAIPRARLEALKDNTDITVELSVTFDKTSTEANAVTFPLRTYTVKAIPAEKPVITNVLDSQGSVAPGGTTYDTTVTLSGTVASGQTVEIFDGSTSLGNATTTGTTWTKQVTGLSVALHTFTAKGKYGSQPVSDPRTLRVEVATKPAITEVRDSQGSVAPGGTTYDTTVTLSGTVASGQTVEIFDDSRSLGNATTTGTTWTKQVTGLSVALHTFTAKGKYGSQPVSDPRTLRVEVATKPAITDVRDSQGSVAPGGTTYDTTVTLSGTVASGQTVEIFDDSRSLGNATTTGTTWTKQVTGLSVDLHTFTAKGKYGSQPVSDPRALTVLGGPRIIYESDFTNGTDGWVPHQPTVVRLTVGVDDGRQSLIVTKPYASSVTDMTIARDVPVSLESGKQYRLTILGRSFTANINGKYNVPSIRIGANGVVVVASSAQPIWQAADARQVRSEWIFTMPRTVQSFSIAADLGDPSPNTSLMFVGATGLVKLEEV